MASVNEDSPLIGEPRMRASPLRARQKPLWITFLRQLLGEFLGIFVIVFVGCGSVLSQANDEHGSSVQVCITFASAVFVAVCAFESISGSHFNPAVTVALAAIRRVSMRQAVGYIIAQLLGAVVGAACLLAMYPDAQEHKFGATVLHVSQARGVFIEAIATATLIVPVLVLTAPGSTPAQQKRVPFVVWCVIAAQTFSAGPLTGASLNPARSFGPAVLANFWESHWVFWVGPLAGSVISVALYYLLLY